MAPLDSLVKQHVAPVMKAAGFRRSGRTFRLIAANGDQAILGFSRHYVDPNACVFEVGYDIVPAPYWEWINRHAASDDRRGPVAFSMAAMVSGRAVPPPHAAHAPGSDDSYFRAHWALREDNSLTCGEALAAVLRDEVVPQMVRFLDRSRLLEECRHPALPVMRLVPLARVEILLRLDAAPSREIESLLADVVPVDPYDTFIDWVRQRVAARDDAAGQSDGAIS